MNSTFSGACPRFLSKYIVSNPYCSIYFDGDDTGVAACPIEFGTKGKIIKMIAIR
jgi:hypothetical protein